MSFADRHAAALRLQERLAEVRPGWGGGGVFEQHRELLGQLVSRVALAQGTREPRHLAADFDDDSARVIVFLDDSVVDASFKEGALIVDVLPLIVASIRITSTQDVLDDARVDPEQPLAVNVTLAEGRTITLRGTGADDDPLIRYLPALFARAGA